MKKIKATIRVTRRFTTRMFYLLSVLTIAGLTSLTMNIVSRVNAKEISIYDNNFHYTYDTSKKTVKKFLEDNHIELGENDSINFPLDYEVFDGMNIIINRAVPVKLYLNGKREVIYTSSKTVSEFLKERNIKLLPSDDINVTTDTLIIKDLEIIVNIYDIETIVAEEEIPYGIIYELSDSIPVGETKIKKQGQPGVRHVTYQIRYRDGVQVSREEVEEEVIASPVNEIVLQGTRQTININGRTYDVKEKLKMTATGYDNCYLCCGKHPGDPGYGVTASGMKTGHGIVAVDPKIIPLGTKLYVEGYGIAIAADTGSAIKGYKVDLFFDTHDEAKNYGVHKDLQVYVLD